MAEEHGVMAVAPPPAPPGMSGGDNRLALAQLDEADAYLERFHMSLWSGIGASDATSVSIAPDTARSACTLTSAGSYCQSLVAGSVATSYDSERLAAHLRRNFNNHEWWIGHAYENSEVEDMSDIEVEQETLTTSEPVAETVVEVGVELEEEDSVMDALPAHEFSSPRIQRRQRPYMPPWRRSLDSTATANSAGGGALDFALLVSPHGGHPGSVYTLGGTSATPEASLLGAPTLGTMTPSATSGFGMRAVADAVEYDSDAGGYDADGFGGFIGRLLRDTSSDAEESVTLSTWLGMHGGPLQRQLSEEEISCLPTVSAAEAERHQQSCSICLEAYEKQEVLYSLHCGHHFHTNCLVRWLRRSGVCPLCRSQCAESSDPAREST